MEHKESVWKNDYASVIKMPRIGTYTTKKGLAGEISIEVTIPKGIKIKGKLYPYKSRYLTENIKEIEKDIKRELKIKGEVTLLPKKGRWGKIGVS
jgi:hypothetical protein